MSEVASTSATGTSTSSSIRRSSSRSRKKKKSQIPYGILVLLVIVAIGVLLMTQSMTLGFYWFTGMVFGFVLQRARFCFTASMRDPYLTGSVALPKAVLTALAVTSIGFWAIQYGAFQAELPIPGQGFVAPVGLTTVIGGIIFGIGMVISGGCASGTLMRVGEGFAMQILSLVFFVVGSFLAAATFGFWTLHFMVRAPRVFLPDVFGWFGAIVIQLVTIALLWIVADKYGKAKQSADSH
ncbi:MAG: YeeE/YedE thiosulfate transporter family protein [Alkalispirochaeta sp.]